MDQRTWRAGLVEQRHALRPPLVEATLALPFQANSMRG